jgi:protein O-GlcNAc transferase
VRENARAQQFLIYWGKAIRIKEYQNQVLLLWGGAGDLLQCIPFMLANRNVPIRYVVASHLQGAGDLFQTLGLTIEKIALFRDLATQNQVLDSFRQLGELHPCPRCQYFPAPPFAIPPRLFDARRKTVGVHLGGSIFSIDILTKHGLPSKALPARVLQPFLHDDINLLVFGTKDEIAAFQIPEQDNLRFVCFPEISKSLAYISHCDAFFGSDSAFKTMSAMLRIPTVVWMGDYVDRPRDEIFIDPYVRDKIIHTFRYTRLDDYEIGAGACFTKAILKNAFSTDGRLPLRQPSQADRTYEQRPTGGIDIDREFQAGCAAFRAGKLNDAERLFNAVLRAQPLHLGALNLIGAALIQLKRFAEAESYLSQAARQHPVSEATLYNYGIALKALNRSGEAFQKFDEALRIKPSVPETWNNRGTVLNDLKRHKEAIADFDKAIGLNPCYAEAFANKGKSLTALERYDDALRAYDRALSLNSDLTEAWIGRGKALICLNRIAEALAAYDRAVALKPDWAQAWLGRASIMLQLGHYEEAYVGYQRALSLDSDLHYADGYRLLAKLNLCDWTSLEADTSQLLFKLRQGWRVSVPFPAVVIPSTAADQLQCAKCYVKDQTVFPPIWRGEVYSHDRIRVGYLSADFHDHATAYLIAGMLESHDRSRFEITGISFGPHSDSKMRRRIEQAFEYFVDVREKTDSEVAKLLRQREIDIAVDLKGFTQDSRSGILARRPVPAQVSYLGFPGTMGANYIDYILADSTVIPEEHFRFYSERVVWLPDSYQSNDSKRLISDRMPTRAECNLPEAAFVFCSFNSVYKINPQTFDIWMRLLSAKANSVLWLIEANSTAVLNLRREGERRGIAPDRLIFGPRMSLVDHLARNKQADLFLDTLPCGAHTTASDALWAGVPVLTCLGETFAGRVAASLLKAVGLSELITTSLDEYEALALNLAHDPTLLAAIKRKLADNRNTYPLFDTARFTSHIESAYVTMWERYQKGEAPKAFAGNRIE